MFGLLSGSMYFYFIDLAFVILLFIYSVICAKKGAIACLVGLFATIFALTLAFIFAGKVSAFLNGFLHHIDKVAEICENAYKKIAGFNTDISAEGIEATVNGLSLPKELKQAVLEKIQSLIEKAGAGGYPEGTTIAMVAGEKTAELICKFVTGILMYFVIRLLLKLFSKIATGIINHVPPLRMINTIFGALFGIFRIMFFAYMVLGVMELLPGEPLAVYIDQTLFVKYMYHNNLLIKIFLT